MDVIAHEFISERTRSEARPGILIPEHSRLKEEVKARRAEMEEKAAIAAAEAAAKAKAEEEAARAAAAAAAAAAGISHGRGTRLSTGVLVGGNSR